MFASNHGCLRATRDGPARPVFVRSNADGSRYDAADESTPFFLGGAAFTCFDLFSLVRAAAAPGRV